MHCCCSESTSNQVKRWDFPDVPKASLQICIIIIMSESRWFQDNCSPFCSWPCVMYHRLDICQKCTFNMNILKSGKMYQHIINDICSKDTLIRQSYCGNWLVSTLSKLFVPEERHHAIKVTTTSKIESHAQDSILLHQAVKLCYFFTSNKSTPNLF